MRRHGKDERTSLLGSVSDTWQYPVYAIVKTNAVPRLTSLHRSSRSPRCCRRCFFARMFYAGAREWVRSMERMGTGVVSMRQCVSLGRFVASHPFEGGGCSKQIVDIYAQCSENCFKTRYMIDGDFGFASIAQARFLGSLIYPLANVQSI